MEIIESNLTVVNEFAVRGIAIRDLIKAQIPGIPGCYFGFKNLGDQDISYPAIFIEPTMQDARMVTLGKYQIDITYNLFFFVKDNDPENITTLVTSLAETLIKLFSNNALGDLSTTFSNKFKAYPNYWINSEMSSVEISRAYVNTAPDNQVSYMRAGLMRLKIQDVVTK